MTLDYSLIFAVLVGIGVLIGLVLYVRIQAFIAMLISSIIVGILAGMAPMDIISTMQQGMGGTLGFVAIVVGLGSIFGAILEHSGGAQSLAQFLIKRFGEKRASWAFMLAGFFVAIPVFFDVGFIILVPIVYALQRKTKKSLLLYAIPLLAGLAITHAFIPPTPGPVAIADILKADLGMVILFGAIAGVPAAIVSGPLFAKFIANKIHVNAPSELEEQSGDGNYPPAGSILAIISLPILLILISTLLNSPLVPSDLFSEKTLEVIKMLGHPFSALILANLIAWYTLGIRRGFTLDQLQNISAKSLAPAGIIILLTGAGGVFKQMLVNTGTGEMLANYFAEEGVNILILAFIVAGVVRVLQGSATVAMITAAGIIAPLISATSGETHKAMIVIVIAAGASMLSHVNDSGFWLVKQYLGLTEKETFKSWTVMTTLLALVGFVTIMLLSIFV